MSESWGHRVHSVIIGEDQQACCKRTGCAHTGEEEEEEEEW